MYTSRLLRTFGKKSIIKNPLDWSRAVTRLNSPDDNRGRYLQLSQSRNRFSLSGARSFADSPLCRLYRLRFTLDIATIYSRNATVFALLQLVKSSQCHSRISTVITSLAHYVYAKFRDEFCGFCSIP